MAMNPISSIGVKFKGVISKDQELLDAAKSGNVDAIGKLTAKKRQSTATQFLTSFLKGSVNINCVDREGYTPLHLATLNGHKAAVDLLLKVDASVSVKDNSGCTPLHLAAWKGYNEICELFLTSPNATTPVDAQNSLGDTALHMAAQYGYSSVVNILLQDEYKADTSIRNLKDESALDLAAQYGRDEVVQLLVKKNPDLVTNTVTSHSPLHLAAACGHLQIINILLDAGFDIDFKTTAGTALHTAAMYYKTEVVKLLVTKGIDVHAVDSEGKTALEIILKNDHTKHCEIEKFLRDHMMSSKVSTPVSDDGNVYSTAFDTSSSTPPPMAPQVEDKEHVDHKENKKPIPKPRVSLGEKEEEEKKSDMYSKVHKDKSQTSPKIIRKTSVVSKESRRSPELKKETHTVPPLPPKSDDIPSLPPKVLSPVADMVVPDTPPIRGKSLELMLNTPVPCGGGVVENEGGYMSMADKTPVDSGGETLSPLTPHKKKPAKPPRKKSPAILRKNEITAVSMESLDSFKEEYETMSNVMKSDTDFSFSEDVYKSLYPSLNAKTQTKEDDDSCDAIYTNVGDTAEKGASGSVPFTKYDNKEKLNQMHPNHNDEGEDMYQNLEVTRDEVQNRSSTGFLQMGKSLSEEIIENSGPPSMIEKEGDSGKENKILSEKKHSSDCDNHDLNSKDCSSKDISSTRTSSDIPNNSSQNESSIPIKSLKNESSIPQNESNIPNKYLQSEKSIPTNVSQKDTQNVDVKPKCHDTIPRLPPKSGGDNLSDVLMSDEKRISNGSTEHKEDSSGEVDAKVPKPSSLEFVKRRTQEGKFPTTPTGYPQPPTPDFPPPSPNTALKGIEQKIAGIEVPSTKRQSRDIETFTEDMKVDNITDIPEGNDTENKDVETRVKDKSESRSHEQKPCDEEEKVVLRRSSRLSSESLQEVLVGDDLEPFAAALSNGESSSCLLKGSASGRARKVVSQIYEHGAVPQKKSGPKRASLPLGNMTFEPVMEKEEDVGQEKVAKLHEKLPTNTKGMKDDPSFDDTDEWDQIADIMASFGAGIDRESVFVEKFEALFTKHLIGTDSNLPIHSVGEWLESLGLGQYENTLYANGFDDTDFLGEKIMEDQDLDSVGIMDAEHRKKILDRAKLLPQIEPIASDSLPKSVETWLNSLRLPQYLDKFITHKYDTMERVLQVWELELSTVLDISSLGHRKRILASLGDRSPQERQFSSMKKKSRVVESKESSPFNDINLFKDYTKVKPFTSTTDDEGKGSSKSEVQSVDNSDNEEVFHNNVQGKSIKDTTIHIRPPHQANTSAPIKQWRHRPEMLIKGCCNYTAQYLGSTLVKELTGTGSTIEGITKLKKSADSIAKIPTIMLSISYRGVKFIDAKSKKVICDHEIVNIFCACQDAESMNFFAYITRDNETGKHYCHVFSVRTADLAREVIMTLGEAFEVAYQMAQKEKAAEEAKEFERNLSQSDAEDSSQSKSSSKASLNTV